MADSPSATGAFSERSATPREPLPAADGSAAIAGSGGGRTAHPPSAVVVPAADLGAQFASLEAELLPLLREVARSGVYVLGPEVTKFEQAFARFIGARHCVAVNSGTSALHLAMLCAGVGPGDEVIVPAMTFIATAWAVSYCGATPVFADVDPASHTLDPRDVERRLTERTKAIVPVHLYGQPADMDSLVALARQRGVTLVEDAAQSHGARFAGRKVGTFGGCACFSFYPGKNLGACGEAGAIVTDDAATAARLRALRDHGQSVRYRHAEVGYNYRMDALQGAVLSVKLRRLEQWTAARRRLADRYAELLKGVPLQLPTTAPTRSHVWHLYVVLHPQRDALKAAMEARGVQVGVHYPLPVHLQEAYARLGGRPGDCPVAERLASHCLSLPIYAEMSDEKQHYVVMALRAALNEI